MLRVLLIGVRLGWYIHSGPASERDARRTKAHRAADAIGRQLARRVSERIHV